MSTQTMETSDSYELRDISEKMTELANKVNKIDQENSRDGLDRPNFSRMLAENGYGEDTLLASIETVSKLNTENRMEILEALKDKDVESIQELANELDRDFGNLSRDLDFLFKHDIIEYKHEKNRKIPVLKHKRVIAKPIELTD